MGQESYDNKIIELINKLLNPERISIGSAYDDINEEEKDNYNTSDG